jgi:hypothetical protein
VNGEIHGMLSFRPDGFAANSVVKVRRHPLLP